MAYAGWRWNVQEVLTDKWLCIVYVFQILAADPVGPAADEFLLKVKKATAEYPWYIKPSDSVCSSLYYLWYMVDTLLSSKTDKRIASEWVVPWWHISTYLGRPTSVEKALSFLMNFLSSLFFYQYTVLNSGAVDSRQMYSEGSVKLQQFV